MIRPCQPISTSMSAEQASSGAYAGLRRFSPFLSGVRLLLVNGLRPVAAGEKLAPEGFDKLLDQTSEAKHQLATKLRQQATSKKVQREQPNGDGKR